MIIFPAIDLKNQKAIRLVQGDFNQQTIYHENPIVLADKFKEEGATHLHIVDLDGAKTGEMIHQEIINHMCKTGLFVQVGGGIRSLETIQKLLDLGVNEVIIGSVAIENKEILIEMINAYPNKIIVSIDAKNSYVLTRGWQQTSAYDAISFAKSLETLGIKKIVYTDVAKDGMLLGPNFEDYRRLLRETNLKVIASGGVTTLDDIQRLKDLGVYGAIIGKAIYEEKIRVKEVIQCLQKESSLV